jgi:hypothetical protein
MRFWSAEQVQDPETNGKFSHEESMSRFLSDYADTEKVQHLVDMALSYLDDSLVVTDIKELARLPIGSAIVDSDGWFVMQSDYKGRSVVGEARNVEWSYQDSWQPPSFVDFPARVIFIPSYAA